MFRNKLRVHRLDVIQELDVRIDERLVPPRIAPLFRWVVADEEILRGFQPLQPLIEARLAVGELRRQIGPDDPDIGRRAAAPTTTKFEPAVEVQGAKLQLNGAGTRYKAIFKVYDMALYTTKKVSSPAELLALPGPKRLQFVALRELPGAALHGEMECPVHGADGNREFLVGLRKRITD